MDSYEETLNTWNKIANLYADVFMDLDIYNSSYDKFCELLKGKQVSVLELGCGPGNISRYIKDKIQSVDLLCTDIATNMIEIARQLNPQIQFQVLDCRDLRSLKHKFEAIICGFTIPYLNPKDCSVFLSDCATIIKEKGIMYLSYVAGESTKSGYQTGSSGDRTYFYFYPKAFIEDELKRNTLEVVDRFEIPFHKRDGSEELHTILILQKQK